jgi:hypothetical protein
MIYKWRYLEAWSNKRYQALVENVQLTIKYPDPDSHQNVIDPQHCLELWV